MLYKFSLQLALLFISFSTYSQSQEEILRDLREEIAPSQERELNQKTISLEKLKSIYIEMGIAMENKDDNRAIEEANKMEKMGISGERMNIRGNAELNEIQILYLKIRRLRAEAFYNLRDFKNALPDSRFLVENHPRPVVFDYTRYVVSLYYSGEPKKAKRLLEQAKKKFKNENDLSILRKTEQLLFLND